MMMNHNRRIHGACRLLLGICLSVMALCSADAFGARESKGDRATELAARRLLKRAQDLLDVSENERGVKMLETIIQQHPTSDTRFEAHLVLGRHYIEEQEYQKSIDTLRHLNRLKKPDEEPEGDDKEMYLEGIYLTGVCHFHMRDYSSAFSMLRQITSRYANTLWANQAYYYIGMSHFAQSHWSKAVESLSLVGTFIDPDSPEIEYAEAGRRLYVKVEDADLPILHRQGKTIVIGVRTEGGDTETIECAPLAGNSDIFLGSIATELNAAGPGDATLQIVGGDTIYTRYVDDNTKDGDKDVPREKMVKVVSSGALTFTLATFESKTTSAFLEHPVYIKLRDADLDLTDGLDNARVKVAAKFKAEEVTNLEGGGEDGEQDEIDLADILRHERKPTLTMRDEITLDLTETAGHSGLFVAEAMIHSLSDDKRPDTSDNKLSCRLLSRHGQTQAAGSEPARCAQEVSQDRSIQPGARRVGATWRSARGGRRGGRVGQDRGRYESRVMAGATVFRQSSFI